MRFVATGLNFVVNYLQTAYREFRQVTWPTRDAVMRYTVLVVVAVVVSVLILIAFDYGMQQLSNRYILK